MDWYSWLSKTGLEPTTVYNYSLLFANNELEEEDIAHFDHDFLLSMGVSIAKHRLEILKLSKKHSKGRRLVFGIPPIAKLLVGAFSTSKKHVMRYFSTLAVGRDRLAMVVAPTKKEVMKRNRRVVAVKRRRLLITNGGEKRVGASPMAGYGGGGEEMRWDRMFHDMKPT